MRTLNEPERAYPGGDAKVAERSTEAGNVIRVIYVERPESYLGMDAFIVSLVRRSGRVE